MNFDVDLGALNLADDLEVGAYGIENPDDYQDQTAPPPPTEGNYSLVVTDFGTANEFGKQTPLIEDGKWPVFAIKAVEILEPEEVKRTVRLNQNIKSKPFTRGGAKGDTAASQLQDLIRSFDAKRAFKGIAGEGNGELPTAVDLLKEFVETRVTLRARGLWKAYDKTYADQAIDAAGGRDNISKEDFGKIINKATIKGMKKFPRSSKGTYIPEIAGPSGEILKAKFVLQFYPSTEKVKLGVF